MRKADLIVVGAGYWGAATAIRARAEGLDVVVLDSGSPNSGSRNASGIVHPGMWRSDVFRKFMPDDWTFRDVEESVSWLSDLLGSESRTERTYFLNHQRLDLGVRERRAGVYLPSNETLTDLADAYRVDVRHVERLRDGWILNGEFEAPRVVVAAGVWTDEVLALFGVIPLGVKSLFGRALLLSGESLLDLPLAVQTRPYKQWEVRHWGDRFRIGDTVETRREDEKFQTQLRDVADSVFEHWTEEGWMEGWRPVLPRFTVRRVADGLVAATGAHRMGLCLAGLAARKALELLP